MDIPADAGFLFNVAALLGAAIKEIHWIIYRGLQKSRRLLYHDKLTITADEVFIITFRSRSSFTHIRETAHFSDK